MVNITGLNQQENELLNRLLDKYGSKDLLECSKILLEQSKPAEGEDP